MRAGTPIVALDAGAVGETLSGAGILLPTARPATVAAAVDRVRGDPELTRNLVAAGYTRLADFSPATIGRRFVDVLSRVVEQEQVVA
jgi:glycosyltransferase involved in cell wall biosynthesis